MGGRVKADARSSHGAADFFSIKGMAVLFLGAPLSVIAMALAMEGAKLVTAGWLAVAGAIQRRSGASPSLRSLSALRLPAPPECMPSSSLPMWARGERR